MDVSRHTKYLICLNYTELMVTHFPTWKDLDMWYQRIKDDRETELKKIVDSFKHFETDFYHSQENVSEKAAQSFCTLAYLREYGLQGLQRNLSIHTIELNDDLGPNQNIKKSNVFLLKNDPSKSLQVSKIVSECQSNLIVERIGNSEERTVEGTKQSDWRVIGYAFPRLKHFYPFDERKQQQENEVWNLASTRDAGINDKVRRDQKRC